MFRCVFCANLRSKRIATLALGTGVVTVPTPRRDGLGRAVFVGVLLFRLGLALFLVGLVVALFAPVRVLLPGVAP